ncbi:LacI family DNA-binding transcriptional regulator [Thermogemmatispora tikiterensis]|uniref:LacI family DNA-binding transcriptional regulator n=1 Tax=Thermogemmatispora tikiterensis TaxID=1825093 RepID=UPI000DDB4653|nr:LacI family DNA-binding transcriptional regulator [Thermogemmatispora tikiterensis]
MRVTIKDVAREAGVSKATVSKYLNNAPYVSEHTRQLIEAAIRKLDFQPNSTARGLRNHRSHCIGVIVASILNPFYPQLIQGIEDVATARGYALLLASSDGDARQEHQIVQAMRQRQVEGIIFASVRLTDREVLKLKRMHTHVILASRHLPDAPVDYVIVDSYKGAYLAVEHLLMHGHRRIAHIGGPENIAQFADRMRGYSKALEDAGLDVDPTLVIRGGLRLEDGELAFRQLMALANPPTAIFAATDNLAFGVLRAARASGCLIPEQLALVGFDNVPFSDIAAPPLTTVDGNALGIGRHAASLLIDRIESAQGSSTAESDHTAAPDPMHLLFEPQLLIRQSCGCQTTEQIRR